MKLVLSNRVWANKGGLLKGAKSYVMTAVGEVTKWSLKTGGLLIQEVTRAVQVVQGYAESLQQPNYVEVLSCGQDLFISNSIVPCI